jgi:hypothetical protein
LGLKEVRNEKLDNLDYINFETGLFFTTNIDLKEAVLYCGESKISFYCYGKEARNENVEFATNQGEIYEVHILTYNIEAAQYILSLIISSKAIIDSSIWVNLNDVDKNLQYSLEKVSGKKSDIYPEVNKSGSFEPGDGWYHASVIAAKAFGDSHKENAVLKYHLAREICDIHPMDLAPYYTKGYSSPFPYDHLKYAYAIIITYSVLEELGLEIRTNGESSTINNGTKWNPIVLENLKNRLLENHINPDQKIPWIVRENMNRPYKKNIDSSIYCEWSDKRIVNDFEISITDGILELSYIRSKISSHEVGERVHDLTICDVENAYSLVRVILLNKLIIHVKKVILMGKQLWEILIFKRIKGQNCIRKEKWI